MSRISVSQLFHEVKQADTISLMNLIKHISKSGYGKQIRVMYGGRCAEEILLGDISTGASNDLERATDLAYCMVMNFAMTESKLVKIAGRPEFNNHIENQSIEKWKKSVQKLTKKLLML